jgi:leader peptidase (prepilin peptidase)/N-methyltransferase
LTAVFFVAVALIRVPALVSAETALAAVVALLALLAYLFLAAVSVALFFIDLETKRLPNVLVIPSLVVGAVLLGTASLLVVDFQSLLFAGIGLVVNLAFYLLLALGYRGGMGWGDVKLAAVLGTYLGWLGIGTLLVGIFLPFLLGGLFAVALLIARRAARKSRIPFGPWMLVGAWIAIFAGHAIFDLYLGFVGLV